MSKASKTHRVVIPLRGWPDRTDAIEEAERWARLVAKQVWGEDNADIDLRITGGPTLWLFDNRARVFARAPLLDHPPYDSRASEALFEQAVAMILRKSGWEPWPVRENDL